MRIRPCIDIHNGKVKQIVGGTLREGIKSEAEENFVSSKGAEYYAGLYREKNLPGGHIILLNARNTDPELYEEDRQEALRGLRAYPGGMQVGGGITPETAGDFLTAGASHVIVTSYVFRNGRLDEGRLHEMESSVGKEHLVLDLSCRLWDPANGKYRVVTDRWQKWTDLEINDETLEKLSEHCDEFLIHAADVEGRRKGIERNLVHILGGWLEERNKGKLREADSVRRAGVHGTGGIAERDEKNFSITYAGGVHSLEDLDIMKTESGGLLDVTVGSALDLFGGNLGLDELVRAAEQKE